MKRKAFLVIFIFSLCKTWVFAENNQKCHVPVISAIHYIESTDTLSFIEFLKIPQSELIEYKDQTLEGDRTYWIKMSFKEYKGNAYLFYLLFNNLMTDILLFQERKDGDFHQTMGGVLVPLNQRSDKGFAKDKVSFFLSENSPEVLIIRIKNELSISYHLNDIEIIPKAEHDNIILNLSFFQGIFLGMLFIVMFINFFLFILARNKLYFYYSFYLLFVVLFFAHFFQFSETYFFPGNPKADLMLFWSVYVSQFAYLLFFLELLRYDKVPVLRNYVKYYAVFILIILIIILIICQINYHLAIIISDMYTLMNAFFVVVSFLIFFRKVHKSTRIVLTGALIMVTGALITSIINFSKVTLDSIVFYQAGVIIEVVLFTISINYTYISEQLRNTMILYQNALLEKEKYLKEKENLELKIAVNNKNREIVVQSMKLNERQVLLSEIVQQLSGVEGQKSETRVQGVVQKLKQSRGEVTWDEFEKHFVEIHQDFYTHLNKNFQNLSSNERKLCAFIKLNLSTKEIASITGKSLNTIDVARSRLRKKMGLKPTDNLHAIIGNIG
ncbi:MAG: 7TM diverse intracellular signaling domain-containing protein [Bacteroidales bacterium]